MMVAISCICFDAWGVLAACLPPTDTYNLCLSSAYFHGVQQSDDKKIATILLRKSLLSSLARVYKHHDIALDADLCIDRPHRVLTGNTMIQVLMGKVWDQQDHPKKDVRASWDHRHMTMITMGKSSWDGEVFCIVDPRRTFTLQSTCNVELLDAYIRGTQHLMWADVPTLTRVIAGLHKVADCLDIPDLGHMDFQDLAGDCNRQLYLLDHYNLEGVDIQNMPPQVRSYVQRKQTVPHCPALEQLVALEEVRSCGAQHPLTVFAIDAVRMLRKSRDRVVVTSVQALVCDPEDFEDQVRDQKTIQQFDHLWDETKCSWNNMVTPAKRVLLLQHRDELNALHMAQYAERRVLHDQWRADPWYFAIYMCRTALKKQRGKNKKGNKTDM